MKPNTEIEKPDGSTSLYLQDVFEGWADEIHDILRVTKENEVEQRDLYDRAPSRPWYDGKVALLGDGIHAVSEIPGVDWVNVAHTSLLQ